MSIALYFLLLLIGVQIFYAFLARSINGKISRKGLALAFPLGALAFLVTAVPFLALNALLAWLDWNPYYESIRDELLWFAGGLAVIVFFATWGYAQTPEYEAAMRKLRQKLSQVL